MLQPFNRNAQSRSIISRFYFTKIFTAQHLVNTERFNRRKNIEKRKHLFDKWYQFWMLAWRILRPSNNIFLKYINIILYRSKDEQREESRIFVKCSLSKIGRNADAFSDEHILKKRYFTKRFHQNVNVYSWFNIEWVSSIYAKNI